MSPDDPYRCTDPDDSWWARIHALMFESAEAAIAKYGTSYLLERDRATGPEIVPEVEVIGMVGKILIKQLKFRYCRFPQDRPEIPITIGNSVLYRCDEGQPKHRQMIPNMIPPHNLVLPDWFTAQFPGRFRMSKPDREWQWQWYTSGRILWAFRHHKACLRIDWREGDLPHDLRFLGPEMEMAQDWGKGRFHDAQRDSSSTPNATP